MSGDGSPWLLLYCLLADRSNFGRMAGPLSHEFNVVLPALSGFGGLPSVDGGLPTAIQAFSPSWPVRCRATATPDSWHRRR